MRKFLQVIAFVTLVLGIRCQSSDDDYDESSPGDPNSSELEQHRSLLVDLYGSERKVEDMFWHMRYSSNVRDTNCGLDQAWAVDDVRWAVKTQGQGSTLTEAEKSDLILATENDIEKLLNHSKMNHVQDCKKYFQSLRKARPGLDCALGRDEVTAYFANLPSSSQCWSGPTNFALDLWIRVVNAPDFTGKCSELEVYNGIVRVAQISKGRYMASTWDSASEARGMDLMAELTKTLSQRHHLDYLTRTSCGEKILPRNCKEVTDAVGVAVCGPLTFWAINKVESLGNGHSIGSPLSSVQDMTVMIEILSDITKIVEEFSKNKIEIQTRMTEDTLETYLGLMDHAIGESAQHIWVQMPDEESQKKLQRVLVNNEQYVGAMSSIYFNSRDSAGIDSAFFEKDAMELKLFKVEDENTTDRIDFEFPEASIETELSPEETSGGLNVYAIHYKSWADLMQKEGLKETNSTGNRTKFFVGKGGIISLSARTDEGKKSIPVTYKMNFDRVGGANSTGDGHVCMSCEYFNVSTGAWENEGCHVEKVENNGVTCRCSHTTNFAAFMSPVAVDIEMTDAQYQAKQIVSYIGSAVSVLSLGLCLVVFNIVKPTIKNDRLKAHTNLAFALFVVHTIQLTVDFALNNDIACVLAAVFTHFFLLASFFWMLIEGIFLYLYVVQVFVHSTIEYLRWIYILGWTIPAAIVAISAGVGIPKGTYLDVREFPCDEDEVLYPPGNAAAERKYERCWLSAKTGMAWSFIAPALLIIVFNTAILVKVLQVLVKVSGRGRNIQPFQPPTSSFASKKETSSAYVNKSYGPKGSCSPAKQKTSESNGAAAKTRTDVEANYGATTDGTSTGGKNASDSPSRFDSRAPSQAYLHNRALSAKPSPGHENSNGKHFVEDVKAAVKGSAVLLPLLGIPWICGLWIGDNYALMMIFVVLNSTQGLVIFIVYCLMNGEVKRALQRHLSLAKLRSQTGRMRTSSTSSMRSLNSRFVKNWRKKSGPEQPSK